MSQSSSRRVAHLVLALAVTAGACSRRLMSVVLDMPAPKAAEATTTRSPADSGSDGDTLRLRIEREVDPVVVQTLLPRDKGGNIDWVAALRDSIIKPRFFPHTIREVDPDSRFNYDIFLSVDTVTTAVFSHTSHLEWTSCQSCHPRLFPKKHDPVTHKAMQERRYCGACHGTVAFPMRTACERCHKAMRQTKGESANGELLGDITFIRRIEGKIVSDSVKQTYKPARFSHWTHRIRYRCTACHQRLYEERVGSSQVTMEEIANGKSCGTCHNGEIAFASANETCGRCH